MYGSIPRHKFQVGDKVRSKTNDQWSGIMTIMQLYDNGIAICRHLERGSGGFSCDNLEFYKEAKMSKYDELKQRIENLKNGWDKEADDITNELEKQMLGYFHISIPIGNVSAAIYIKKFEADGWKEMEHFSHSSSQYDKLDAFKEALLWLLDHSDIKKDEKQKQEKIEQLETQLPKPLNGLSGRRRGRDD